MTRSQCTVTNSTYKLEIYPHVMVMDMAFNNAKFSSLVPYAGMTLKNTTTYNKNIELNAYIYST